MEITILKPVKEQNKNNKKVFSDEHEREKYFKYLNHRNDETLESDEFDDPEIFMNIIDEYCREIEFNGTLSLDTKVYFDFFEKYFIHIYTGRKTNEYVDHTFIFYVIEKHNSNYTTFRILTNSNNHVISKIFHENTRHFIRFYTNKKLIVDQLQIDYIEDEWNIEDQRDYELRMKDTQVYDEENE